MAVSPRAKLLGAACAGGLLLLAFGLALAAGWSWRMLVALLEGVLITVAAYHVFRLAARLADRHLSFDVRRVLRGDAAVALHPDLGIGLDFEDAAGDIIADVLHAATARGVDPDDVLRHGEATWLGDLEMGAPNPMEFPRRRSTSEVSDGA
jgi:hypothetical protein